MIDLIQRRREMMGASGGSLPYDAEIEYLQGSGTQYIDTLLKGNLETRLQVVFMSTNSINDQAVTGSRETNSNSITIVVGTSDTNQRFGSKARTFGFSRNRQYNVTIDKSHLVIDGASYNLGETNDFTTQNNICVFYANALNHLVGNIYSFKMWQSDALVRDMIPVRVGTTGYMYDRVSGELFGNTGTGDFGLGNDKN